MPVATATREGVVSDTMLDICSVVFIDDSKKMTVGSFLKPIYTWSSATLTAGAGMNAPLGRASDGKLLRVVRIVVSDPVV